MTPSCRLAAVVIARDESRCIARCLSSVRQLVDKVVLLDTGSTDDTVEIAELLGVEVHRFAWTDDFSAARNRALDIADAAWNLSIDADEWLVAGDSSLDWLTADTPPFVGKVKVVSAFDDQRPSSTGLPSLTSTAPSWISRLLPYGVRYSGRVHEQPQHAMTVNRLRVEFAHDGYLARHRLRKADRNRRLLERDIADRPDDAYLAYQLGKDHEIACDFADAARWYAAAMERPHEDAGYVHDLVIRRMHTLKCLGRHAEAIQLAEGEMASWPASPDFYFALGDVLLDWAAAEPLRAGELLPMAEASWTRCIDLGDSDAHEGAVAGRGSWLAAHNLAVLCNGTGRPADAARWRETGERSRTAAMAMAPVSPS